MIANFEHSKQMSYALETQLRDVFRSHEQIAYHQLHHRSCSLRQGPLNPF